MSIIKQKKQRVAIFIDAQNLYHSAKSAYGSNVNFKNILDDTLANRELVRAIAYVITTESGEEKSFFDALTKAGIETKSKDLQVFFGGAKKSDWDVGITVDAIRLAPKVDAIIIVSGDGDFIPLVEYLKFSFGCQVEATTFKSSASAGLIKVVDDFFDLSENLGRYLMRSYQKGVKNKYYSKHRYNQISNNEIYDNLSENILEEETPEMIAERRASKRKFPMKNKTKKENSEIKKEATEVEILRVKSEDFIEAKKESQEIKTLNNKSKRTKSTENKTRKNKKDKLKFEGEKNISGQNFDKLNKTIKKKTLIKKKEAKKIDKKEEVKEASKKAIIKKK